MIDIKILEAQYIKAKIAYYEGYEDESSKIDSLYMTDLAFDELERILKERGSKVIEQVGRKRKDFDVPHPTPMLSQAKIQTEEIEGVINYMEEDFMKWYNKRAQIIGTHPILEASAKFDGNAINMVYVGEDLKLSHVATRGDGFAGKDVTEKIRKKISDKLKVDNLESDKNDIIEIRGEVVIPVELFNRKYKGTKEEGKYANARNYVAGVLGKDDVIQEKVDELEVVGLHYIINGEQVSPKLFNRNKSFYFDPNTSMLAGNFVDTIKDFERIRETYKYLLDGVVIAFPVQYRSQLGENKHDPEWSIAIKFVPDEVATNYKGIEWNVGKTGELAPVVLLEPVQLAGTEVKRASGYNAGYIIDNRISSGARFTIAKAGEIIPEIQSVVIPGIEINDPFDILPQKCPACENPLLFDGIHLVCDNNDCSGRSTKKLATAALALKLKGVGAKTLEKFADDFNNMFELIKWVKANGDTKEVEKYGIVYQSRTHELFLEAFDRLKSMDYAMVIRIISYSNVGKSISAQVAKEFCGLEPDYFGLDKSLIAMLKEEENRFYITNAVSELESLGIAINRPEVKEESDDTIYVCLTGSPKSFGYATKGEFLAKFPNMVEVSLSAKQDMLLITDAVDKNSGKMAKARKINEKAGREIIKIVSYESL